MGYAQMACSDRPEMPTLGGRRIGEDYGLRAWVVEKPAPIDSHPLKLVEKEVPHFGSHQVLVKVLACGVCRTDLHLAEGDLVPRRPKVIPGHEIIGIVAATGDAVSDLQLGDRIGIAWLRMTCGKCKYCRRRSENLCSAPLFTGWDEDGGFAEYATVDQDFAYRIPPKMSDEKAAPLLCSGIIGYRALRRANLPKGGSLGIYGFGASAHLTIQIAIHEGARVHVITRSEEARQAALKLGASSVGDGSQLPPEPLDSAILFAPDGNLVPRIMEALDRGGTLAIGGIYMSDIPSLSYDRHLFQEKEVRSVTANTRKDGEEFLDLATRIPVRVNTVPYNFSSADRALEDLAHHRFTGAAVLLMDS